MSSTPEASTLSGGDVRIEGVIVETFGALSVADSDGQRVAASAFTKVPDGELLITLADARA